MENYINKVIQGDCLIKLKELEDNSIDSIVTDPPAGISFMGKSWDTDKGGRDNWIKWMQEVATECKRVLKPGGHAFVWAIPRTSHWTATAWENAGFEIRDVVAHVFGSGFPKSHNIEKAVQKIQPERSNEFKGIGTALKPAREDWLLMRKPLDKGLTIAENCLKWGTGGINIDGSRVEGKLEGDPNRFAKTDGGWGVAEFHEVPVVRSEGRFPANLILGADENGVHEEVRECFPDTKSGGISKNYKQESRFDVGEKGKGGNLDESNCFGDSGNASRFFKSILYYPKASKSERNNGMDELEAKPMYKADGSGQSLEIFGSTDGGRESRKNNHPTVKPIALMEYLIKMVTPKSGIVLDPFAGSGTTLVSAKQNGFQYIGIELTEEYIPIIEARLSGVENDLFKDIL